VPCRRPARVNRGRLSHPARHLLSSAPGLFHTSLPCQDAIE
jgi:hypothetical protein